jgi:OOP family OmpA-OmpF porin
MKKLITALAFLITLNVFGQKAPEILGEAINSKYNESQPVASPDGRVLFFTVEGHPFSQYKDGRDIWMSVKDPKGEWQPATRLPNYINSGRYNAVFWTSTDGNRIVLRSIVDAKDTGRIKALDYAISTKDFFGWSTPQPIKMPAFKDMTKWKLSYLTMSTDEKTMIDALSTIGNGEWFDLWVSQYDAVNKVYSAPVKLAISDSTADEYNPQLSADNRTLYYSVKKKGGVGGYDIWVTRRIDNSWENWTTPVNLGSPINTRKPDVFFSVGERGKSFYVVVNDKKPLRRSKTGTDIARVELVDSLRPKVWINMFGSIYDSYTKEPVKATVVAVTDIDDSTQSETIVVKDSKNYKMEFAYGSTVQLEVKADSYNNMIENLSFADSFGQKDIWRDIYLTSQKTIDSICNQRTPCDPLDTLNSEQLTAELGKSKILFDFGSSVIRAEAYRPLQILSKLMMKNPDMVVELRGHTDAVGMNKRNHMQSEERAISTKLYLVSLGINPDRIIAKGYADETPIAPNDTDEGRQLNRRVDFKIVKE